MCNCKMFHIAEFVPFPRAAALGKECICTYFLATSKGWFFCSCIWRSRFYLLEPIVVICSMTESVVRWNASTLYITWLTDASSINYSHWMSCVSVVRIESIRGVMFINKITLTKMQKLPMHILTSEALNACWIVFSFSRPLSRRKFSCSTAPVSSSVHTTQTNSD